MKTETETETGGANTCEACACIEAGFVEPPYTVGLVLCGDCEAYYGVADYLEGNK